MIGGEFPAVTAVALDPSAGLGAFGVDRADSFDYCVKDRGGGTGPLLAAHRRARMGIEMDGIGSESRGSFEWSTLAQPILDDLFELLAGQPVEDVRKHVDQRLPELDITHRGVVAERISAGERPVVQPMRTRSARFGA